MATNMTSSNGLAILKSSDWKILISLFYSMLFLVGTVGNLLVIYIFGWLKRGKRKTSELLLLTLGVFDLSTSVLIPPMMVVMVFLAGQHSWFILGCQVIPFFLSTCVSVTQMILIIICYDRYRAIVTPLKASFCWRLNVSGIILGCILGLILDIPLLLQGTKEQLDSGVCFDYTDKAGLMIAQASGHMARDAISFGIMAYFIRKMLISLKKSASFRNKATKDTSSKDTGEFSRTRRLLYAVLVVFAICIWPTDICFLVLFVYYNGAAIRNDITERIVVVMSVIMMLQTLNSSLNVFIYSAIHPDFKKVLRRIKDTVSCTGNKADNHKNNSGNGSELTPSQPRI